MRDLQRILLNLVVGPLLGGAFFFAAAAVYEVVGSQADNMFGNFDLGKSGLPLLLFCYFLGGPPWLINGLVMTAVAHLTSNLWARAVIAFVSGGIWCGLIVGWIVYNGDTMIAPPPLFTALAAISGAIAALLLQLGFERASGPGEASAPAGPV